MESKRGTQRRRTNRTKQLGRTHHGSDARLEEREREARVSSEPAAADVARKVEEGGRGGEIGFRVSFCLSLNSFFSLGTAVRAGPAVVPGRPSTARRPTTDHIAEIRQDIPKLKDCIM